VAVIPYGQVTSYGAIAQSSTDPKTGLIPAARALGAAADRHPISIIIPCHLVIGA
jgi:methylated-DNA-[protein]-cysteine S-methyltransferase